MPERVQLVCDDVVRWAATYAGAPFHAMLADPPYHLSGGFMGAHWDKDGPEAVAFRPETWAALARHLLPGAFVMAFASSRGWHRLACAMEDAGLIIHPSIFGWGFGSGFPKATRIDTTVDRYNGMEKVSRLNHEIARARAEANLSLEEIGQKMQEVTEGQYGKWYHRGGYKFFETGMSLPSRPEWEYLRQLLPIHAQLDDVYVAAEREILSERNGKNHHGIYRDYAPSPETAPSTPLAQTWAGHRYGLQALKPALEPIIVAQVPYARRPVDSITTTGAGSLWIEGARIGTGDDRCSGGSQGSMPQPMSWHAPSGQERPTGKRWPANFALCHTPQCQPIGEKHVQGTNASGPGARSIGYAASQDGRAGRQSYASPDGTETVQEWTCAEGCTVASFDAQAGNRKAGGAKDFREQEHAFMSPRTSIRQQTYDSYGDDGPCSRFFFTADWSLDVAEQLAHADPLRYQAKASRAERDAGMSGRNTNPCIKPLGLLKWLATLLLPPAAYAPRRLLVPFAGSGSECIGGLLAGWEAVIGIEQDSAYVESARQRMAWWTGYAPQCASAMPKRSAGTTQQLSLF